MPHARGAALAANSPHRELAAHARSPHGVGARPRDGGAWPGPILARPGACPCGEDASVTVVRPRGDEDQGGELDGNQHGERAHGHFWQWPTAAHAHSVGPELSAPFASSLRTLVQLAASSPCRSLLWPRTLAASPSTTVALAPFPRRPLRQPRARGVALRACHAQARAVRTRSQQL